MFGVENWNHELPGGKMSDVTLNCMHCAAI